MKSKIKKNKSTDPVAAQLSNNSIFYKLIWYAIWLFVVIVLMNQFKRKPNKERDINASFTTFFNGTYQTSCENKLLNKPFIENLKKYKNEYEFLFFNKVNLDDCYAGKENYIFGESMTKAYFGDDYYGEAAIKNQVQKAKFVQDKLHELGIELLILFAPGKSSIYTEFLPEYLFKTPKKTCNSEMYVKQCTAQNVNFIDFIRLFSSLKTTTKYPLFSKYGSHWSYYSECIVIDTTVKRLETLMKVNLPNIKYSNIELKDTSLVRDADIFRKTQMKIPKGDLLAYPKSIGYEQGVGIKPEKVLGIGDSYFRGFFYLGAMKYAFDNAQQWYYYNSIIPENPNNPEVWELDLKTEILKHKAILILCNEMNLENLGNGFIDDAYELFSDPGKYYLNKNVKNEINKYKKEIRNKKEILAQLTKESQQKGIPLDSLIAEAAIKLKHETGAN